MSETLDDRVKQIRARADVATKGPWEPFSLGVAEVRCSDKPPIASWMGFDDSDRPREQHVANAKFIAHAREDVPWLLDQLAVLRAQLDGARKALEFALSVIRSSLSDSNERADIQHKLGLAEKRLSQALAALAGAEGGGT